MRGDLRRSHPVFVATWALGGLYLSLGPSLAPAATGSPNLLWGGLVIFGSASCCSARAASPPGPSPPRVRPCHRGRARVRRARRPWDPANG